MKNLKSPPASEPQSPQYTAHLRSTPPVTSKADYLGWRLKNDPLWQAKKVLKIISKGKLVPLEFRYHQKILINIVRAMRIAKLPVRIIVLKARRVGISTAVEALGIQETSQQPFRRAKVVAHVDESAKYIFGMTRTFYDELPDPLKPPSRYESVRELTFENPDAKTRSQNPGLRSKFTVSTAGSKEAGRGEEVNFLHLSEMAFYPDAAKTAAGLLQTVDYSPDTSVFIESTANGVGNYFHDMYWKSLEGKEDLVRDLIRDYEDINKLVLHLENFDGNVGFIPLFFPWHEFEDYQLPTTEGEREHIEKTLDADEQDLRKLGLNFDQLKWRRAKIDELAQDAEGRPPTETFKQEYPSNAREAFLATGSNIFDAKKLMMMKPRTPQFRGRTMSDEPKYKRGKGYKPTFMDNPHGELQLYRKPKRGRQYAIGADVAFAEKGRDSSCIQGLDKETLEHVFEWHGKTVDPDELGKVAMHLGCFYNNATVAVERNNMGIASIIALRDSGYPYLYVPKTHAKRDAEAPLDLLGWETTSKTKSKAIADMAEHIRRGLITFNSHGLISECLTFKVSESGRLEAEEGKHDDRVMAMAITLQVVIEYPKTKDVPTLSQILHEEDFRETMEETQPAFDKEFGDVLP